MLRHTNVLRCRYKKSPAQVSLRFLLDKGIAVIPSAHTADYMIENLDVHTTAVSYNSCHCTVHFPAKLLSGTNLRLLEPIPTCAGRQALAIEHRGTRNLVKDLNTLPRRQLARTAEVLGRPSNDDVPARGWLQVPLPVIDLLGSGDVA